MLFSTLALTLPLLLSANSVSAGVVRKRQAGTVYSACSEAGTFALTFDDGPYQYESQLASTLNNAGATGTFFLNGNNWACIYDVADQVKAAYNAGHLIGQHTWSHPDLTQLSADQIRQQFTLTETAFKKIIGIKPRFFRPPYGSYNNQVLQIAQEFGYEVILWNLDTEDGDNGGTNPGYGKQQYSNWPAGEPGIGLEHSPYQTTVDEIVPFAISNLKGKNYKLVSVAECLGYSKDQWYQATYEPEQRDNTWTCN